MNTFNVSSHESNIELLKACKQDDYWKAESLLKQGANPDFVSISGESPIRVSIKKNNIELVALLILHKGNNAANNSILNYVCLKRSRKVAQMLLMPLILPYYIDQNEETRIQTEKT